ncbi:substrate-binding domain-containing protein [Noviherbaspirillum galbum]|uniref:ABC transporter substrate-binding protein n=1 Tax=Noviherbaspirillum galbum TaxID=2709383 RepID=A0A6B3SWU5_9BURK|nr:substrate-binding domain-containing protein [Noviherbaspirillum galbum]NEX62892.1 ABC transporter substrate-binding protein [Noviherbaspirillum galbum]
MYLFSLIRKRTAWFAVLWLFLAAGQAFAAELRVVSSGGLAEAYRRLAPEFERRTGHTLIAGWGPSMGDTVDAIPNRLKRGESIDVVIMVGSALDGLIKEGKIAPGSAALLARSNIGVAVKAGARKPDISTVTSLKDALINARSIAYSDSASGVYLSTVLFPKLGIADAIKTKSRMIPAEPVARVVARGDAEIGFQQISELLPVAGIDVVGPLPPEVQHVTLFSVGIVAGTKEPEAANALIQFLLSPEAASVMRETGLEPSGNAR